MSYSRWSNSRWYTFWTVVDDGATTMDGQTVDVDCTTKATYGELAQDFKGTLARLIAEADGDTDRPSTEAEREELAGYLRAFMADVVNDDATGRDWTDKTWQRSSPERKPSD